jgi:hypothetical protein
VTHILPLPPRSGYLTNTGRRATAAAMIDAADGSVTDGLYVADVLDLLAGTVLRLANLDDNDARAVLAALWRAER